MKNKLLKLLCVGTLLIMSIGVLCACNPVITADRYTDAQHLQRVSQRARAHFIRKNSPDNGKEYTDMEVYPLYNAFDQLEYFLIDLEPYGYAYVKIDFSGETLTNPRGMYMCSYGSIWCRYRFWDSDEPYPDSNWGKLIEQDNIVFELDDSGDMIKYENSHFKLAGIRDEKRYLLEYEFSSGTRYIPAVKRGEKYLNLVSMEEFGLDELNTVEKKPDSDAYFTFKRLL